MSGIPHPELDEAYVGEGVMVNSGEFDGLYSVEGREKVADAMQAAGIGTPVLILGIGVDNGVYVVHNCRSQKGKQFTLDASTAYAMTITSITNMVGFGSLMLAASATVPERISGRAKVACSAATSRTCSPVGSATTCSSTTPRRTPRQRQEGPRALRR